MRHPLDAAIFLYFNPKLAELCTDKFISTYQDVKLALPDPKVQKEIAGEKSASRSSLYASLMRSSQDDDREENGLFACMLEKFKSLIAFNKAELKK